MYDDLARTQQRPFFESFVLDAVIPSVIVSFVMNTSNADCSFSGRGSMRAMSSVASVSIHAALGAAILFGTTKRGGTTPTAPPPRILIWEPDRPSRGTGAGLPSPDIPSAPDLPPIPLPDELQNGAGRQPISMSWVTPSFGTGSPDAGAGDAVGALFGAAGPEVLAGPRPAYPELLRQAGIEGRVVLEAVVDSTGRVLPASVAVVFASNPGFAEPARQSLVGTLFRPARVNGRAVATLVRVPFAFFIQGGTGRAR